MEIPGPVNRTSAVATSTNTEDPTREKKKKHPIRLLQLDAAVGLSGGGKGGFKFLGGMKSFGSPLEERLNLF